MPSRSPADQHLWSSRAREVGWVLLPLRLFLGVTMVYAGLLKLLDSSYLDPSSPNGVPAQMAAAAGTSPIGPLVSVAAEHATLFGLAIAFGELVVGLGVLLGLWTRLAAVGGLLLSTSFFLTVTWGESPYFFGADIVFMFAFTPLVIGGDGGVLSLQRVIRDATRRRMRLAVPAPGDESAAVSADVDRRTLLRTAATVAAIGVGALVTGAVSRVIAGNSSGTKVSAPAAPPAGSSGPGAPTGGVGIANVTDIPVGGVQAFTDPATGSPAYLMQPKAGIFLAYSGVCTHEGCTVGFDQGSNEFACPCHGARFDGSTGDVLQGPAQTPLTKINVAAADGVVYAV